MILFLTILLCVAAVPLLLLVLVLFTEVAAGRVGELETPASGVRPRVAVLMPAHNEAAGISNTLRTVLPQLGELDRLVVVADNCSDETAAIAAAAGAEVIQRVDAVRRGKGYALAFGVRYLQALPSAPEIVIIIDADCEVAPNAIDRLARLSGRTLRPAQALYLMSAPAGAGLNLRVAQFAWLVKNQLRPLGLRRLGLACQLMGSGMAFPWSQLTNVSLATGHIVEDMKLGIDLALARAAPLFCPEAIVTSRFPTSQEGVRTQRTRWEHGHLSVILSEVPRLLRKSFFPLKPDLLALALDLSVPPLALLLLLVVVTWLLGAAFYALTYVAAPLVIATAAASLLGASVLLAWLRAGRDIISGGGLALALLYPLRKIPLYARFLVARQIDWVRSRRDGDEA